jgi:2-hydroxy-3-oxopropionate reductase
MNTASTPLGFLGLGAMGGANAARLLAAGFAVHGYDLAPARLEAFAGAGGRAAGGPEEVLERAEIIFTSLPSSEAWIAVAEQMLVPRSRAGQLFVDLGTTVPHAVRRLAAGFAAAGAALIDAPVSGGERGAREGRLRIFAGGDPVAFARARPYLAILGGDDRITHCGPSGAGQVAKGVNQLKSALQTAALVEALSFAVNSGVAADVIAAAFGAGAPAEASGIVAYARKVAEDPEAHFGIKFRELPYYVEEARARGFPLPLTEALHAFCDRGDRVTIDDQRPAPSFWRELRKPGE